MPTSNDTSSSALVVINGATLANAKLVRFQKNTAKQLALIERTETDNVKRRLFVGIALHVIKESLPRGTWLPWLKKNAAGQTARQCQYMMAAAQVFIKTSSLGRNELAALPAGKMPLLIAGKGGPMRKVVEAASDFVGDMTWGELLAAHDIKAGSLKLGGARGKKRDGGAPAADPEQLYLFARDEIGGTLQRAEELFLKENRLQHLAGHPEEVRGVVASLRALADRVEEAAKPLLAKS